MTRRPLVLLGGGGLASEVLEAVRVGDTYEPVGVLDDDPAFHGRDLLGVPVLGDIMLAPGLEADFVVCPGQGSVRAAVRARLLVAGVDARRMATVMHPDVRVPGSCTVPAGCVLLSGVVLTARVRLGLHVVCMPGSVLTHDVSTDDFATLASGVLTGGGVRIGREAYIGAGASLRQGVNVGSGAMVGMGSVVLEDVPAGRLWFGVPARDRGPWPPMARAAGVHAL